MKTIGTCLWFDGQAEEAANFYVSIFPNSKIGNIGRQGDKVLTVSFTLDGRDFFNLNGGPMFKFNEAVSLVVYCDTQEEIDRYWSALTTAGGSEVECGWLKDKFGLSWQIVPSETQKWISGPNSGRVMEVVMRSKKLNIAEMKKAAEG
jgi:predicted 3-demethylubiquinone-9 3-methyltransferase (glyoxalase superfamily)